MSDVKRVCRHTWCYPHVIFEGRRKGEIGVVRYCHNCGLRQMAFTSAWGKVPKGYVIDDLVKS